MLIDWLLKYVPKRTSYILFLWMDQPIYYKHKHISQQASFNNNKQLVQVTLICNISLATEHWVKHNNAPQEHLYTIHCTVCTVRAEMSWKKPTPQSDTVTSQQFSSQNLNTDKLSVFTNITSEIICSTNTVNDTQALCCACAVNMQFTSNAYTHIHILETICWSHLTTKCSRQWFSQHKPLTVLLNNTSKNLIFLYTT